MSQPMDYQYRPYADPSALKAAPPQMLNGQAQQNGMQPHFNLAGTPSSQSSRDPSRETSRDPSPTPYIHNQYRARQPAPSGAQNPVSPASKPIANPASNPITSPISNPISSPMSNPISGANQPNFPPNPVFTGSTGNLVNVGLSPATSGPPPGSLPVGPSPVNLPPGINNPLTRSNADVMPGGLSNVPVMAVCPPGPVGPPGPPRMGTSTTQSSTLQNTAMSNSNLQNPQNPLSLGSPNPILPPTNPVSTPTSRTGIPGNPPPNGQGTMPPTQYQNYQNYPGYYGKESQPGAETENVYSMEKRIDNQQPEYAQNYPRQNVYQSYGQRKYNYGTAVSGAPSAANQKMPPPPFPGQRTYPGQPPTGPLDSMNKRYPDAYPDQMNQLNNQMNMMTVTQAGFNKLWGMDTVDLLQCRNVLPPEKVEPPKIKLHQEFLDSVNCSPDIFRCTLTKIPESNSLLQKSRLPLGVLIHPFKDLNQLLVIQCSTIVRCRACRTYINPFVYFVDSKRWKCNLCYRVNELPEEFQFDPVTKSYGDPSRRPEVKTSTIEFIAPSEYMLRPPQPAVYLFIMDVSRLAVESGYLSIVCNVIAEELSRLPGDGRTQIGFLAVDSAIHFFSIPDNVSQPHEMIMLDIDDVFLPCPDNLIVNLKEREELVRDLLAQLPGKFQGTHDTNCALGAALQAAYKLMSPTGGRVTVFQTCLPTIGPGQLQPREDPGSRTGKDVPHLNPVTDFYKRLALDCSGQQIAVDLFLLNSQYCDLATLSGMCKFSGGCIYHLPLFRASKPQFAEQLERMLRRYLTRKIGFEAVMRIRCTRGLSIHTFHGNFFVRSTDLLSLPNVNPDAGFGMQIAIEENLADVQNVCFQAALLYTSSKGERRIRVHTLCLPVVSNLSDVLHSADQQCIIGLLSKMAVDRSQQSSLPDARDALINVAIDVLSAYKLSQSSTTNCGGLLAPTSLRLLPVYILALLKCVAFRAGPATRLDDRLYSMSLLKSLPLSYLLQHVYPDLYPLHTVTTPAATGANPADTSFNPGRMHLSAERVDSKGCYLMDAGDRIFILVGKNAPAEFCIAVLGTPYHSLPEEMYELPELKTVENERIRGFVFALQEEKPYHASLQIIRDDSHQRGLFVERLIEDRFESALSYYEFLQHLKTQVK